MKTLILLTLASALQAQAQTAPPAPPCNEHMTNLPCRYQKDEAYMDITDMMIENRAGMKLISRKPHPLGRIKGRPENGFIVTDVRMTYVSRQEFPRTPKLGEHALSTTKYEILLDDCRGTDACSGSYLWTVIAVTDSDGYSYDTKYTNNLVKTEIKTFNDEDGEPKK